MSIAEMRKKGDRKKLGEKNWKSYKKPVNEQTESVYVI